MSQLSFHIQQQSAKDRVVSLIVDNANRQLKNVRDLFILASIEYSVHSLCLTPQKLFRWHNFLNSLENICRLHHIAKLLLAVFQEDSLPHKTRVSVAGSFKLAPPDQIIWILVRYLVSCSDDVHSSQDEALTVHVALVSRSPSPHEVLPHTETNEAQPPHLPLQRAVEMFLQTHNLVLVSFKRNVYGSKKTFEHTFPTDRKVLHHFTFLSEVGQKGEGPGEMAAITSTANAQGDYYDILDTSLILIFSC